MAKYDEIVEAFRRGLPRRLALNAAVEELPARIRDAVAAEIEAPKGNAPFASSGRDHPVGFVYLARAMFRENGTRYWDPCSDEESLFSDSDGVLNFGLGLEIVAGGLNSYLLTSMIAIEDITHAAITIRIVGAPGNITIYIEEPNSYQAAAAKIGEWILAFQSDPRAALDDRSGMGFGRGR